MVGAACAGRLSDRLGRRKLIIIAAIIFTAGSLLAAPAPTVGVLIAARFIIGLAVGSAALVVPLYLSEIAPTNVRGAIASLNQLMIVSGILAAFIVNAIAIKLIDRAGRKPLLIAGVAGMVTSLLVLGISLLVLATPHHPSDPAAIITLVCLGTFIASLAATWGPVVWVMIPEVLPLSVRGTAMGVAVLANWAANFLVSQTFPIMLNKFGPGPVFLGYAGMGVLAFVFVAKVVKETKGRSLEEIEADLQQATGTRQRAERPRETAGVR
jgi:MFS family permease